MRFITTYCFQPAFSINHTCIYSSMYSVAEKEQFTCIRDMRNVVLPQATGPTTAINSPRFIVRFRSEIWKGYG